MSEIRQYEFLLVLDAKGADDVKKAVDRLTGDFEAESCKVINVQNMDRRELAYAPGPLAAGCFVNFVVEGAPSSIDALQSKFKLDKQVYRQNCRRLSAKKLANERTGE